MTMTTAPETITPPEEVQTKELSAPVEIYGVIGEFEDVDTVMGAAHAVRDAGYQRFDVHSPFPIHGIDEAMGIRPTILPWIVFAMGTAGCLGGLGLVIFTMATSFEIPSPWGPIRGYEFLISGKPLVSLPAFIPVIFECTILLSAFGAAFGMLLLNRLPMLFHPLFRSTRFRRATSDRFFIAIEAKDERFDRDQTTQLLESRGALTVEVITE